MPLSVTQSYRIIESSWKNSNSLLISTNWVTDRSSKAGGGERARRRRSGQLPAERARRRVPRPHQKENLGQAEDRPPAADPCSWRPDQFVHPAQIARYASLQLLVRSHNSQIIGPLHKRASQRTEPCAAQGTRCRCPSLLLPYRSMIIALGIQIPWASSSR